MGMADADVNAAEIPEEQAAAEDLPVPPASFSLLVVSLKAQAEMALGLMHFGEEDDRRKPDLRIARHSIDLLGILSEKTKGNLSLEEQRLVENSLTELRFRYIQVADTQAKQS